MARVKLLGEEDRPELAELIGRIKGARRGSLLNVYRLLLHSPAVAEAWMALIDALRRGTALDGRLREIAIIRVGHLNRSAYEVEQHVPRLALAEGLTPEECAAVADWERSSRFDERERAVLAYADAVTRDVQVADVVFEPLRRHFDERQIVELTILIGAYNMHGRVIEPLEIDPEPGHRGR